MGGEITFWEGRSHFGRGVHILGGGWRRGGSHFGRGEVTFVELTKSFGHFLIVQMIEMSVFHGCVCKVTIYCM